MQATEAVIAIELYTKQFYPNMFDWLAIETIKSPDTLPIPANFSQFQRDSGLKALNLPATQAIVNFSDRDVYSDCLSHASSDDV